MQVKRYTCEPWKNVEGQGSDDDWCIAERNDDGTPGNMIVFGGMLKDNAAEAVKLLNLGAATEAIVQQGGDMQDKIAILLEKHSQLIQAKAHSMWLDDSGQGEGDEAVQHTQRAQDIFNAAHANLLAAIEEAK